MITPSHLVYNWAIAKASEKIPNPSRTKAFVVGALLPDLPTYGFFFIQGLILGTSQQQLWNDLYFDSVWTPFITLSHSLVLWPALIGIGYALQQQWLYWLASSAFIHSAFDFFVHADDAYRHFWPFSNWKFESPISYWDPQFYGQYFGILDTVVALLVIAWLYRLYQQRWIRYSLISLAFVYLLAITTPLFYFIFTSF
ncbi:MAG: metal-dependent hydrolase [Patescibacteria group bacterium]